MSYEALSSLVPIGEHSSDSKSGSNAYSKRKNFTRQPTFISHPFHLSTSGMLVVPNFRTRENPIIFLFPQISFADIVDWIANDLGYIEVVFDNPFAISLELDKVVSIIPDYLSSYNKFIHLKSSFCIPEF